jgi:trehalose-6-phosphate synthase
MLEGLQAWVAEADGRMMEAEATPIGTDIETVEGQLASHEVRVEREATLSLTLAN